MNKDLFWRNEGRLQAGDFKKGQEREKKKEKKSGFS